MRKFFVVILIAISGSVQAVPFKASKIMISAHCPYATQAGIKIAEAGGNVVDVALTTLIVMSVTNPSFGSLGGGGFALVKTTGDVEALDFREVAPRASSPDYFKGLPEKASIEGGTAVAVPGLPAGIEALHKKYGKIHWSRLFEAAIKYAEAGFRVTGEWAEDTDKAATTFNASGKKYFLKKDGTHYKAGELFKQPQLAKLLREVRNRRTTAFYSGLAARDIVESVKAAGGSMSLADLTAYKPVWRKPIVDTFDQYKVYLMPPPSSGGVVISNGLRLVTPLGLEKAQAKSADEYHRLIELFKRSYRTRALLGDPEFFTNPTELIFGRNHLENMIKDFDDSKASQLQALTLESLKKESTETSHLSVMDSQGSAVAMTITVNGNYGSGVVTEKYGVVMNNEMDDFTTKPGEANMFGLIQGEGNKVQPGKRPLSSMSPTLVEKDGKIILSVGAPGGPRIISSVFQVLYRILVKGDDVDQATQAPRVHHQFMPDTVFADTDRMAPEIVKSLQDMGHKIEKGWQGRVYAVHRKGSVLEGAFDSRGEGSVSGF